MKLYVVSSRVGVEMCTPEIYKDKKAAEEAVKRIVADKIRLAATDQQYLIEDKVEEDLDALIESGFFDGFFGEENKTSDEAIIEWADQYGLCGSYNCDFIDTACIGDDWTEARIDEVEVAA